MSPTNVDSLRRLLERRARAWLAEERFEARTEDPRALALRLVARLGRSINLQPCRDLLVAHLERYLARKLGEATAATVPAR